MSKIDRIIDSPIMAWRSRGKRISDIENTIDPGDNPQIGNGLIVVGNVLKVDVTQIVEPDNNKPLSSNGLATEMEKVETALGRI